jgi:hypothetical protein
MGCGVVLFATYLYSKPERPVVPRLRMPIAGYLDEERKVGAYDDDPPKSADGRDLKA